VCVCVVCVCVGVCVRKGSIATTKTKKNQKNKKKPKKNQKKFFVFLKIEKSAYCTTMEVPRYAASKEDNAAVVKLEYASMEEIETDIFWQSNWDRSMCSLRKYIKEISHRMSFDYEKCITAIEQSDSILVAHLEIMQFGDQAIDSMRMEVRRGSITEKEYSFLLECNYKIIATADVLAFSKYMRQPLPYELDLFDMQI
jgi:hypothetical protein